MSRPLVLAAHGTRDPAGPATIARIARAMGMRLRERGLTSAADSEAVRVAYVDVVGPTVGEVVGDIDGAPVVLPAFLASGYHVRTDLPTQLRANAAAMVTEPLGPSSELARAMRDRLAESGWQHGECVLFTAAGSSDERALADVRRAAQLLGTYCGQSLRPSYITTPRPLTTELCTRPQRVFLAPYLLAPGLFHRTVANLPVTATAEPIGAHPAVVELIVQRYRDACHSQRPCTGSAAPSPR